MNRISVEIWLQIIGDDARLYNTLIRTISYLHKSPRVTALREVLTSTFKGIHTTNGLVHTIHSPRVGRATIIHASYGKLVSNRNQPSFLHAENGCDACLYADDGMLSRNKGPAARFVRYIDRRMWKCHIYAAVGALSTITVEFNAYNCDNTRRESWAAIVDMVNKSVRTSAKQYANKKATFDGQTHKKTKGRALKWRISDDWANELRQRVIKLCADIPDVCANFLALAFHIHTSLT